MNSCTRWAAAVGTGLTLTLGLAAPAAAAPGAASAVTVKPAAEATASAARLPSGWKARQAKVAAKTGVSVPGAEALRRLIDGDDYVCGPTALDAYVAGLFEGVSDADLELLFLSGALIIPTYEALFFGTSGDPRFALTEQRQRLTQSFRDAKRFWDIPSSDIQLMAMHGDVLQDRARIVRVLTQVFGVPQADAAALADLIVDLVARVPALRDGDNPIFTLNAFAFTAEDEPADSPFAGLPDKIIFGDGIIDFLEQIGIGDVGSRAVMAHEFAHHVQFEKGLFDTDIEDQAEATRRTELMADAMGTYFATHKRGLALNAKRVLQAERTFYEVGDCAFDNPGHHGTPLQRERAARWGADLAASAQKKGHVLPALTVARLFDEALPRLVAPDAR